VDDENEVTEVGLALEPSRGAQPKLPVFQNLSEIAAWIRGWLRQRRARRTAPPAPEPPAPPPTEAAGRPE
ncbi:hypothetical protein, partial [Mycobacterium sp. KBS0706]|uniref:hypothetical protein n=1 Tax=Mycobacterium sp. KBS0706 TaxID=2578109 RepID=UPI001C8F7840